MNKPAILTPPMASGPGQQNLTLFRIYVAYRTLLCVVLLIMLFSPNTRELVGAYNPTLYVAVAIAYLATSVALMGSLSARLNHDQRAMFAVFMIDVIAITLLADASGGMASGLPILLIIAVAASAVLISKRTLATLIAAIGVLATLIDTVRLISIDVLEFSSLFPVGILGLLTFGVSILIQTVSVRLGRAEELARTRASDLYNLQRLNEQIVQHMDTGILLVDSLGTVRVMNKAATTLLAPERPATLEQGRPLAQYSEELANQFTRWQSSTQHKAKPFSVQEGSPPVVAHFRELQPSSNGDALVFVEDYTPVTQYAQSLKLTALGRLTASIAHEIRNPLGAISHAAQLLQESEQLAIEDKRMADIIVNHCQRVNQIVESVMQISRREPPKPEYLLLAEWLSEFVNQYLGTQSAEAVVTIDCDYPELLVEFDPENLSRVLSNLLDNGLRHSRLAGKPPQATIRVSIDFISHLCFVDVIDGGDGVPAADIAKLFEPFFTTVKEGSGMGLFLCKELCEVNNADLSYRKTAAGESCFRIAMAQRAL